MSGTIKYESVIAVIRRHVSDACQWLKMDAADIDIRIDDSDCIFPPYKLADAEDIICFHASFLARCVKSKSYTPVRHASYRLVRQIWQRKQGLDPNCKDSLEDSVSFAIALELIQGLMLDPLIAEQFKGYVEEILKKELNLDASCQCIVRPNSSAKVYIAKLSPVSAKKELEALHKLKSSDYPNDMMGTKEHPFEDINAACSYICKLEAELYDDDAVLTHIGQMNYFYNSDPYGRYGLFCIPFASPFVSMSRNNFPKNAFILSQNRSGKFVFKPNLFGRKFLFRGQTRDYPTCTPSMFRDPNQNYFLEENIFQHEMMCLIQRHPLVKLFDQGVELLHDRFSVLTNLGGLTQHYYNKTSFLDLTSDMEAMRFFATNNYDWNTDTYSPVTDEGELGVIYLYALNMPEAFHPKKNGCHLSVIGKQVFSRPGSQHGFLFQMPRGIDFKSLPEVRCIYFRHNAEISRQISTMTKRGRDFFPLDALEIAYKEQLRLYRDQKRVSADAVRMNVLLNRGETYESICRKLDSLYGIEVDNSLSPDFTREQLHLYYQDIKNGWWEAYCQDLYFYGAECEVYKEELLQVEKREEYKWAFIES